MALPQEPTSSGGVLLVQVSRARRGDVRQGSSDHGNSGGRRRQRPFRGKATTTVSFSEPGEYVLQAIANDYSGEGGAGEVCCWTTTMVKVTVTP
jgi:hypothetical protein